MLGQRQPAGKADEAGAERLAQAPSRERTRDGASLFTLTAQLLGHTSSNKATPPKQH